MAIQKVSDFSAVAAVEIEVAVVAAAAVVAFSTMVSGWSEGGDGGIRMNAQRWGDGSHMTAGTGPAENEL